MEAGEYPPWHPQGRLWSWMSILSFTSLAESGFGRCAGCPLFYVFHVSLCSRCVLFAVITIALVVLLIWITWIRRQYAFGGGRIMEQVHRVVLSHLDYDGEGKILEVGCGSGALTNPCGSDTAESKVIGIDYWGAVYNYSKALCEKNCKSEGVASRCVFQHGDAEAAGFS